MGQRRFLFVGTLDWGELVGTYWEYLTVPGFEEKKRRLHDFLEAGGRLTPCLVGESCGSLSGMPERHVIRAWLLDFALVTVACAAPVFVERLRGLVRAGDDLGVLFLPNFAWWWGAARWLGGWNPWIFGGFPANADPQFSQFHPLALLYVVAAPADAAALEAVLGPSLAAAGMLLYLRAIGVGRVGRLVGALSFALGGFMAAQAPHPPHMRAALALPWALAAIEALEGRALVAGLGGAVAAILVAGHPQVMAYTLGLVLLYAAWLGRPRGRRAAALAGGGALGALLSAGAWLPALHLVRVSTRALATVALGDADKPAMHHLLRFVVPFVDGGSTSPLYGASAPPLACGLFACAAYPGMLVWVALLAGAAALMRDRRGRFWCAIGLLGLLLGAGVLPAVRGVRAVVRFWLWCNIAAAVAGALVLDGPRDGQRRPARAWWIAGVIVACVVGYAATGGPVARRAALGSGIVLGLTLLAVAARRRGSGVWLVAVAGLDLASFTAAMPVGVSRKAQEAILRRVAALREAPVGTRHDRYVVLPLLVGANWAPFAGVRLVQGYGALVPARFAALLGQPQQAGFVELGAVTDETLISPRSHVLDLLRCRIVASLGGKSPLAESIDAHASAGDERWARLEAPPHAPFRFHLNRRSLPVAWLVHRLRVVPDDLALALVRGLRPDQDFDPTAEALVAEPVAGVDEARLSGADEVVVTDYADDRIDLAVRTSTAALLVTSELAYPGWAVTVDGESRPVLTANAAFRAVAVPAGRHEVVFLYRPVTGVLGLCLAATGLAVLVSLVVVRGEGRQKRRDARACRIRG